MKNTTYTLSNIIAGVLFLIHAFWQLIYGDLGWIAYAMSEYGFAMAISNMIHLDFLLKYEFESIIIFIISLVVGVYCFIARKNASLILITAFGVLGMFMANSFLDYSVGLGLRSSLPSIVLFLVAILSIKSIIPQHRLLKNILWLLPLIVMVPTLVFDLDMTISYGIDFFGEFLHHLLYCLGCSLLTFWCIYSPDVPTQKATVNPTASISTTKYCSTCGKEIHINAVVCPNCGCAVSKK